MPVGFISKHSTVRSRSSVSTITKRGPKKVEREEKKKKNKNKKLVPPAREETYSASAPARAPFTYKRFWQWSHKSVTRTMAPTPRHLHIIDFEASKSLIEPWKAWGYPQKRAPPPLRTSSGPNKYVVTDVDTFPGRRGVQFFKAVDPSLLEKVVGGFFLSKDLSPAIGFVCQVRTT